MGTHFLWHALSGLGAYFMLDYLYYICNEKMSGPLQDDQPLRSAGA
jgi:hypothetical protein